MRPLTALLTTAALFMPCAATVFAQEPAAPNLVPNPSFDELDENGWPQGWRSGLPSYSVSTEDPRTGSRCLKWQSDDPDRYDLCSTRVDLQPGKRYEFGGWVRTKDLQGRDSGATFCLEWWDGDGRYIRGTYPRGVKGDNPHWTLISAVSGRVPENSGGATNLLAYVRRHMTGTAWFDDVFVRLYQGPLVEKLVTSLYRETTTGGEVRARIGLNLQDYDLAPEQITAALTIRDAEGGLVQEMPPARMDGEGALFTFDSTPLPVGAYTLHVRASARDSELSGEDSLEFQRVDEVAERKAYIDEHQRLILDGEPFFPLGTYWNTLPGNPTSLTREHLDLYADSPFNCIMPYDSWNITREQLDMAHERGIRIIFSVKDFFAPWRGLKRPEDEYAMIADYVTRFGDHPAIMAWYINDELPLDMYDSLRAHQVWMEELDPGRPTWVVLYQVDDIPGYLGTFDVIGTDPYPVPAAPVSRALDYTRRTVAGTAGLKPLWQVPQIFNWASYRREEPPSAYCAPSLEEMRSMAWQCIIGGANGLVFYSWMDLWRMDARGEPFAERWPDIKTMAGEIADLFPVLLSVEPPVQPDSVEAPPAVAWRLYAKDDATYLATVNSGDDPATATFHFPRPFSGCEVVLGRDTVFLRSGALEVRFGGTEPRVIRLTP